MASRPHDKATDAQLVTFGVDGERFAVEAGTVREVVRPLRLTRVPHAPPALLGLGNLRGAVLPVVSLGVLLGKPAVASGRVIVLEQADPIGVMVDDVSAVVRGRQDESEEKRINLATLVAETFGRTAGGTITRLRVGTVSAATRAIEAVETVSLLAFAVAGQEFALPLSQIEEVIALPAEITIIPKTDEIVIGAVTHRGVLLPLLSLRHLLGLTAGDGGERPRVVLVRIGNGLIGLVVDAIRSLLRVPASAIDAVPAILTRGAGEARIQAICRLDGGARLVSVLAAEQLLRGGLTTQFQTSGEQEGDMTAMHDDAGEQFLVFRIGDQDFGLPIGVVDEVVQFPPKLARLPRSPAFVQGVMNLRGKVIPVIDQGMRFDRAAAAGRRHRVIIVSLGDTQAGFAVDSVAEVLRVPAAALRDAPELGAEGTRVFDRVANLEGEGRMILIVEPQELLDRAERDLLAATKAPAADAMPSRDGT